MLQEKIENNFDCLVIVDGVTGIGKSTLAIQIARYCKHYLFNYETDLIYSQEEFIKAMKTKYMSTIISDEMINIAFTRDWFQKKQKDIIKLINMNRDHNNLIILCVPNFADLDKKVINACRLRLTVIRRGYAIIQSKNETIYSQDKWDINVNEKIERDFLIKKKKINYFKLTTFRGMVHFHDLPPVVKEKYLKVKDKKRSDIYGDINAKESFEKNLPIERLMNSLLNKEFANKTDYNRFAEFLEVPLLNSLEKIRQRMRAKGIKTQISDLFTDNIKKTEQKEATAKEKDRQQYVREHFKMN